MLRRVRIGFLAAGLAALAGTALTVAPAVLPGGAASPAAVAEEWPWPPPGPKWETDPEAAMQRARDEGKGIFVYVATDS